MRACVRVQSTCDKMAKWHALPRLNDGKTHAPSADIKQYIGNPSPRAIYQILRSCLLELMRVQIIAPAADFLPVNALRSHHTDTTTLSDDASASLFMCSVKANGLSGRALRKIPFLAHAKFLRSKSWRPTPAAPLLSPPPSSCLDS